MQWVLHCLLYLGWISTNFLIYNDIAGQNAAIATVQKVFGTIQGKASMLQDLEKGRKCEIRFIDGVVSDEGKKLGILTPYTDAVVTIVSEIEDKKTPASKQSGCHAGFTYCIIIIICNTYTPLI